MNYDEQKLQVNEALHHLELLIDGSIAFIDSNWWATYFFSFILRCRMPAKGMAPERPLCKRRCNMPGTIITR